MDLDTGVFPLRPRTTSAGALVAIGFKVGSSSGVGVLEVPSASTGGAACQESVALLGFSMCACP